MTDKITEESWHKHLEFIQNVVTRMAQNSYLLKGWTVTLVAATFALSLSVTNILLLAVALLPTIAFAILDAYYLRQERLFRTLYDKVRRNPDSVEAFSLNTSPYSRNVDSIERIIFSVSICPFYIPIALLIVAAILARLLVKS